MTAITSTSNQRVKLARKLQRKRYRQETGLCIIEGMRLIEDAARAGTKITTVFVSAALEQSPEITSLLQSLHAADAEILSVTEEVLAAMTETVSPQGIAAFVRIPQLELPSAIRLALVLDKLRDPGNAGTLLRSAAAAGADLVIFGPETVDPYNDKVLRAGMGAHFRLPVVVRDNWVEVSGLLNGCQIYIADASGSLRYDEVNWEQPSAVIVGSEAHGPSDSARELGAGIAIPMYRETESLNAAMAGSIILFEAARGRLPVQHR